MARILTFDVETAGVNALKSDLGFVVCFGYKWLHEPKAKCLISRKQDLKTFSDRWLLKAACEIFEEAELVVGHYASVFDRRFLQGRMLINRLPPLPPTKMRDTCMIARSAGSFSSNRLGHLADVLKLSERKQKKDEEAWPGWWFRTMQGDMKALRDMAEYCKQDVLATEQLYLRLRAFDNPHPRVFLSTETAAKQGDCGACGGVLEDRGTVWANGKRYHRSECRKCKRWGKSYRQIEKEEEATKLCPRCGRVKTLDCFVRNRTKIDGIGDYCRECHSEINRINRKRHAG